MRLYLLLFGLTAFQFYAAGASQVPLDTLIQKLQVLSDSNSTQALDYKSIYCNDIAVKYQGLGKNEKARTYFLQAIFFTKKRIEIENNWGAQNLYDMGYLYQNLATFEGAQQRVDVALKHLDVTEGYYNQLKPLLERNEWIPILESFYETSFTTAFHGAEFERARYYMDKAKGLIEASPTYFSTNRYARLLRLEGELYAQLLDYRSAEEKFRESLAVYASDTSNKTIDHYKLRSLITALYHQNKFEEIDTLLKNQTEYATAEQLKNFSTENGFGQISSFLDNVFYWSYAKIQLYKKTKLTTYLAAANALQFVGFNVVENAILKNEADRMNNILASPNDKVEGTITCLSYLQQHKPLQQNALVELLRIIDVYNSTRLHLERISYSLNADLWKLQKQLNNELIYTNKKLDELSLSPEKSTVKDSIRQKSYQLSLQLQALSKKTKKEKILAEYEIAQDGFDELVKAYVNTTQKSILVYFHPEEEDSLFILGLTPDTSFLTTVMVSPNFTNDIGHLYNLNASIQTNKDSIALQQQLNANMYKSVFEPIANCISSTDILLYPINEMSYISFDALLDNEAHYLVESYNFQYTSSLFSIVSEEKTTALPPGDFASFYPSNYGDDSLAYLLNAKQEVNGIAELLPIKDYQGKAANKTEFLAVAQKSKVVHIASHSILNFDFPYESYVVFDKANDTAENKLYAYEIFSLTMDADMVTLSSCNSAKGKLEDGIGVVSLSNAFYFAGVPATISSLWSAQDGSSAKIMVAFYDYLCKGETKSSSLRQAKLDYLKNADKIHQQPFFWANYVLYGSDLPLYNDSNTVSKWVWYTLGTTSMLMVGFIIFIFQRRRNKKSAK